MIKLQWTSVEEITTIAAGQIVPIDPERDIREYFILGKNFLEQARFCRKKKDLERTYMFLVQYILCVQNFPNLC